MLRLAIDTETTGLLPAADYAVTEVAIVNADTGKVLLNELVAITERELAAAVPRALEVQGFDPTAERTPASDVWAAVDRLLVPPYEWVGQHVPFDWEHMEYQMSRYGFTLCEPRDVHDTKVLAKAAGLKKLSLMAIADQLGIDPVEHFANDRGAHAAVNDALLCAAIYRSLR